MTTVTSILTLPNGPFNGSRTVGIIITSGVPTYLKVTGTDLNRIVDVNWYPEKPGTVLFEKRNLILVDNTIGTCMITVTNNYLYDYDRGGRLIFKIDNGRSITVPVRTFGRVSLLPLWSDPGSGLITG